MNWWNGWRAICCGMFLGTGIVFAEPGPQVRLWNGNAPLAKGAAAWDIPTLQAYPVSRSASGNKTPVPAILICPGGGYGGLAVGHEGDAYARFFNEQGMSAFVLRYRLGSRGYRHPVMLLDAARAMRTIRSQAGRLGIDPGKIGVIGSSAGGHLAATLLTKFDAGDPKSSDQIDRFSSRPDFGVLCYPVISMKEEITHRGSRNNLLGMSPDENMVANLSAELQVRPDTPPCFIWHTAADPVVPVENSLRFASALKAKKIPFALHVYENGSHGIGLALKQAHPWPSELLFWLRENQILKGRP